jgi:hypothetical protein
MAPEPPIDDLKALWRDQEPTAMPIHLAEIRERTTTFERRIRRRNRREYLGVAAVILGFGCYVWLLPGWLTKLGSALVIVGALFVAWRLHRRGSPGTAPADAQGRTSIAFLRGELIRQRDLLKTVWFWYLGPLVPGMALMMLGEWLRRQGAGRALAEARFNVILTIAVCALVFLGIGFLNVWAAAKLQRRIDGLDALLEEEG